MAEFHRSLVRPAQVELDKVRGSRFIGDAAPAPDEAAAMAWVEAMRQREPAATHHCWAFRLADGRERSSDDGEPGGTAGPPILRRITGAQLVDVVVVVTRYYGGVNLGTGGLVRAYGACAAAVLEASEVIERPHQTRFSLRFPYDLTGPVEMVLASFDAQTQDATYGQDVHLHAAVAAEAATAFTQAMAEATAGRVNPQPVLGPPRSQTSAPPDA